MEGIKIRCQCAFSFYVVFGEGCHLVRCPKCQEYVDKDGSSAGQFPDALSTQLRDPQEDDDTDEGPPDLPEWSRDPDKGPNEGDVHIDNSNQIWHYQSDEVGESCRWVAVGEVTRTSTW